MKKILSLLLCVMLVVTMIPGMAFAEGTQSEPSLGDIRLFFDMPSNVHAWVPGQSGTITTIVEQYVQDSDNGDVYWEYMSNHSLTVDAYFDNENKEEIKLASVSGTDININVPLDCPVGSTVILKITGSYGGKFVTEETRLDIVQTSYTIDRGSVPSSVGLGETVDFIDAGIAAMKHTFVQADAETDTSAYMKSEPIENPKFDMEYNWNRTEWEPVAVTEPAVNGLEVLKRVNRNTVNVDVRLLNESDGILAVENFEFGWLDLYAGWNEIQNDSLRTFTDKTEEIYTLNKSTDLNASPDAEIEFVLGIFGENAFEPFSDQDALFDYVSEGDKVTGVKLNITEIDRIAAYNDDDEFWFGIRTKIKYGNETLWNDSRSICLTQAVSEYKYRFENNMVMLPNNGRGLNKNDSVEYYVENSAHPNGNRSFLEITGAVSSNPSAVTVVLSENEENWDINAVGLGHAVVTLTHEDGKGGTKTINIDIDVREENWNCEFYTEDGVDNVFPGRTLNYKTKVEHWIYNADRDEIVPDENLNCTVNWSFVNQTDSGYALLKPSADTKTLTIDVASNAEEREIPVKYQVLDMNSTDADGNHPVVDEGVFRFWISNEYHSFDVTGFKDNLAVGETITVTLEVIKHKLENGVESQQPVDAAFTCDFSGSGVLEVAKDESQSTSKKAIYTIKRLSSAGTDIHFTARWGDGNEWGRGYGIQWIDNGGNDGGNNDSGPADQIFWVMADDTNPPSDLRDWNDWFSEKIGTVLTIKFAVNDGGQTVYLDDIVVHDEHEHIASIEKVNGTDDTFKITFKQPGEFRMYTRLNDTSFEIHGEAYRGVSGDDMFYGYTKKTHNDGSFEFVRMEVVPSYNGFEIPEFYTNRNDKDDPDEFYVLWPTDEPTALRPDLDIFAIEGFNDPETSPIPEGVTGITVTDEDDYKENGQTYLVWKLTVGKQFEMARVGIEIKNIPYMTDYTYFLWVLGEKYYTAEDWYCYNGIFAVAELPEGNKWDSFQAFDRDPNYLVKPDGEYMVPEINMNMSLPANDERNSFYIIRPEGIETWMNLSQLHAFHFGGTALGFGGGGQFEKLLDESTFTFGNPIPVKIGNENYEAIKVTLNEYLGHSNLIIAMGNEDDGDMCLRARITFGMDVYLTGDTKGIKGKIRDSHNILNEVLGFKPVSPDFDFVDYGNGVVKTYFDKACAVFDEKGQGMQCGLDIELKPGYVVTDIKERVFSGTTSSEKNCNFVVNNIYYYDVYNGKTKLDTDALLDTVGWGSRIGSEENNVHKAACFSSHTVAAYGYERAVGEETVNDFNNFLKGDNLLKTKLKAKKVDAYTDYTLHFNAGNITKQCAIVLNIENPDDFNGSKVDVHGKNNVKVDKVDNVEFSTKDNNKVNNNLVQLEGEGLEVKTVYNIQVEDHDAGDGIVMVTIPESELDGRDLSEYKVVFFDDNGIPMEMQTTYIEGKGLVFTTGHFSTYAVIGPQGSGNSNNNSGTTGGLGGYGGTTTPSGSDNVTNNKGSASEAPSTNADMSQSTTMKGNETATTVDQTTADKIVDKAVANKSEEIVIDATYKTPQAAHSTKAAEVAIPAETMEAIAEKTEADVTIKTDVAEIKLDNAAAAAVADQAEGETVSIVAVKVKESAKEVRFELKVVCSEGKVISDFKGGNVSITVNVPQSLKGKKLVCVYFDANGHAKEVEGYMDGDKFVFRTGHFSTYALMTEEDAAAAIAKTEKIKAGVEKTTIKLKSTLTKKGNVKLTWTKSKGYKVDYYEVFRSIKKNSGYGKKPFYVTASGSKTTYTNTKQLKAGKTYYYRVRGVREIAGEKVYTKYSNKAWRTIK